jgi:hypothetical protein
MIGTGFAQGHFGFERYPILLLLPLFTVRLAVALLGPVSVELLWSWKTIPILVSFYLYFLWG